MNTTTPEQIAVVEAMAAKAQRLVDEWNVPPVPESYVREVTALTTMLAEFKNLRELVGATENEAEVTFKRQFVIQWLAAIEAVNYQENCYRGWKDHSPPVEDAYSLADSVWTALEQTK